jgi:NAD(P)-dependent dehydrogenase (short-subunit alcohol dehydrogenase family)
VSGFTIDLGGKVALVTGASRGLGFAMADGLAGAGADLVIVNRTHADGERAAERLRAHGGRVLALPGDVTRPPEIARAVRQAEDAFGRIDVLLNNAGMNIRKPVLEVTEEDWDRVLDGNLKGVFFTAGWWRAAPGRSSTCRRSSAASASRAWRPTRPPRAGSTSSRA